MNELFPMESRPVGARQSKAPEPYNPSGFDEAQRAKRKAAWEAGAPAREAAAKRRKKEAEDKRKVEDKKKKKKKKEDEEKRRRRQARKDGANARGTMRRDAPLASQPAVAPLEPSAAPLAQPLPLLAQPLVAPPALPLSLGQQIRQEQTLGGLSTFLQGMAKSALANGHLAFAQQMVGNLHNLNSHILDLQGTRQQAARK